VRYIIFSYERFCIPTEEVAEAGRVLPVPESFFHAKAQSCKEVAKEPLLTLRLCVKFFVALSTKFFRVTKRASNS
jgi:hypothetical protein